VRVERRRALAGWAAVVAALAGCGLTGTLPPGEQLRHDPELGRELIAAYGCVACHAVPGIPGGSDAVVAPPLAGMGARRTIAGRLPNTPENMARWISDPQGVDPGNLMPDLGVTLEEARHIAAYLYSLR
jgi:cytochrome c